MKHIRTIVAVIITLSFSPAKSEVLNDIQHRLMDLSGLSPIINTPKLETTDQRNQFFDNYSVLSIPDIKVIDQIQLQNIQTFAPSHRKVSLDSLNKIKDITSGLTTQDITVTLEDFKDISMQDGKITAPNISNKSQQVKDILSTANAVLQEVKSLNQKELNSLKLTVSDMRNIQKIMPIIQQQLDGSTFKDGKINGVSVDVGAMTAEINNARQELNTLVPKLTFADFSHLVNAGTSSNGKLILPNYNKDTASDNINRFIEISNQGSKYIDAGLLSAIPPSVDVEEFSKNQQAAFVMKGVESIKGKKNGFLNIVPDLGMAVKDFISTPPDGSTSPGSNFYDPGPFLPCGCCGCNLIPGPEGNLIKWGEAPPDSQFEYMTGTTFRTFKSFIPSGDYTFISVTPFLQLPVEPPVANGFLNTPFNSGSVVGDFTPNSPDLPIGIGFIPGIVGNQPHVSQ